MFTHIGEVHFHSLRTLTRLYVREIDNFGDELARSLPLIDGVVFEDDLWRTGVYFRALQTTPQYMDIRSLDVRDTSGSWSYHRFGVLLRRVGFSLRRLRLEMSRFEEPQGILELPYKQVEMLAHMNASRHRCLLHPTQHRVMHTA